MRKSWIIGFVLLLLFVMSSCGCNHQWEEATCTSPKLCEICGQEEGEVLQHEWVAATCTEPKTCFLCKLTDGDALGHDWVEATCDSPKTCSLCGEKSGDALGHVFSKSVKIKKATCTETGIEEGTCSVCEKTLSVEIPTKEHTTDKWEVDKEATYDQDGIKTLKCKVCGNVLQEESYELTEEEKEAWYKNNCEIISYKDLARTPDDYVGKRIKITGEVAFIWQEAENEEDYSIYYVYTKKSYGYYYEEPFFVFVDNYGTNSRILQGDVISFYGETDGLYEDFGEKQPKLLTTYYDLK